jgi:7-keto-8-aminopelargonate synthetase-like enzyme
MAKSRTNKFIDTIDECLTNGVKNGIFQVSLEDDTLNGRNVTIGGQSVVSFGSCSYLGLEVDQRLKQGAIDAAIRYGVQYSSSRLFSSCNLYEEFEDQLQKIFGNPSIMAPSTTLSHLGALPVLIQDDDLIILDHQVHGSVQLAVQVVKSRGTKVEMIKHNNMQMLEDLVKENPNKYNKIWYMADGLYSMYGDFAPLKDISYLMEKYGNFHVYIDDAHAMSWAGKNGAGYVLSQMALHAKMILSTSLSKGFGAAGGATVFPDAEMKRKVLTCGSSYTFSGPEHPPMLGACIASAKIHLSEDIYELQSKLKDRIDYTQSLIEQHKLPLVASSASPIFYIGLGLPRVGYNMVKRLLGEGFYTNIGIFPGVPVKCCGLRLAITNGQTKEDIKNVLDAFQYHFPRVLEEENQTVEDISNNFALPFQQTKERYFVPQSPAVKNELEVQHETTIHRIDKALWDELLGDNGTFDWEGCRFIEETFQGNPEPENNWDLHYVIIRDSASQKPILATFFSVLLCKDDLISSAGVSKLIEQKRKFDPYHLTSRVVMMGSLLSVGEHLYVDRENRNWKSAMLNLIDIMNSVRDESNASMIQLRDFDSDDIELNNFFLQEGFVRVKMPDAHIIEDLNWKNVDEYLDNLSLNARRNLKKTVIQTQSNFDVIVRKPAFQKIATSITAEEIHYWYELYLNVKKGSFNLNTFNIPYALFENFTKNSNWDIFELKLKSEPNSKPVAVIFSYISSGKNYSPFVIGLDYNYVLSHGSYRQGVFQSVLRAKELNCNKIYLGMDASVEKQKFGARIVPKSVFIQNSDNFNMEMIEAAYTTARA